jgi:hypothetical protein
MAMRKWRVAAVVGLMSTLLPLVHGAQPAIALSCATGGACKLGDMGPKGGVVFYTASTPQWWGQYMESFSDLNATMRNALPVGQAWLAPRVIYQGDDAKARRVEAKRIGAGAENYVSIYGQTPYSLLPFGLSGWSATYQLFYPSKDELDALYNYIVTTDSPLDTAFRTGVVGDPYWTSTEASDTFAWYQLFNDGTQFTDANGIVNGLAGNKTLTKSSMHKGSAFPSKTMRHLFIGAWAPSGAVLPPKPPRPVIPPGGRTSADCAAGRSCQVGDIGPGGGVVFYDAGKTESWGRYLEASPASCQKSGLTWRSALPGKRGTRQLPLLYPTWATAARQRVESKRLGMGKANTALVVKQHKVLPQASLDTTAAGYADSLVCGGKDDWFLPSKDELDTLYNVLAVTDNDLTGNNSFEFTRGFYWTSSEYNNETAWTQLWIDGQQFDREKWMSGDKRRDGGFNPFHVRPIRAFG